MTGASATIRKWPNLLALTLVAGVTMTQLSGCGCGFDCNSDGGGTTPTGSLTLGLSDAPLDDASEVVLVLDQVVLRGSGINDVTIDRFTVDDAEADTVSIDLLQYPGLSQLAIIEDLELVAGTYTAVELVILDGDLNFSYVIDSEGQKPLNADSSTLLLPGLSIEAGVDQSYTIEFELGLSLSDINDAESYRLSNAGIRVVDNSTSASVSGSISTDLFSEGEVCAAKPDPLAGNRVYLYSGHGLLATELADAHTADSAITVPAAAIAPLAMVKPLANDAFARWDYIIAYLPAGDYTLAFSCAAEDDHPVDYDGFAVPAPEAQLYEITLTAGNNTSCDLAGGADCGQ
jgi:hypothetical protein